MKKTMAHTKYLGHFIAVLFCFSSPFQGLRAAEPRQIVDKVIATLGPARNQKDTDLCFSHAAADVISYELGQKVSAMSVAMRYFENLSGIDNLIFNPLRSVLTGKMSGKDGESPSPFMLGFASEVLKTSLEGTLCPDDQPIGALSYRDAHLKNLHENYELIRTTFSASKPNALYEEVFRDIQAIHPKFNPRSFEPFIKRENPLPMAIGKWYNQLCKLRLQSNKKIRVNVQHRMFDVRGNSILDSINHALNQNSIPILHIDTKLLYNNPPSFREQFMGFHVVTIVAKNRINNVDYYLLRNTWGPSCKNFGTSIAARCDRGHFWINEQEIAKYVTTVAYYQFY